MPWLSIIMAVLAFFLSGGANKEKRGTAALAALGVGAGTYAVTHNTDWGQENLGWLDGVDIQVDPSGAVNTTTGPASPVVKIPASTGKGEQAGTSGLWGTIGGWLNSPAGQATTGVAGAKAVGLPNWLVWGAIGLFAYTLTK